jgi:hypothetical protein
MIPVQKEKGRRRILPLVVAGLSACYLHTLASTASAEPWDIKGFADTVNHYRDDVGLTKSRFTGQLEFSFLSIVRSVPVTTRFTTGTTTNSATRRADRSPSRRRATRRSWARCPGRHHLPPASLPTRSMRASCRRPRSGPAPVPFRYRGSREAPCSAPTTPTTACAMRPGISTGIRTGA